MEPGFNIVVQLVIGLICGCIAIPIANHKGRSAVGWFFLSLFFGLVPIIIVSCLSNLKTEKSRQERTENEARRLREQLRQERLKSEAFRQYSMVRLDNHDKVLGVDTRDAAAGIERQLLAPQIPPVPALIEEEPRWYYEVSGVQQGPVPMNELRELLVRKQVKAESLLWSAGMAEWTPARDLEAFRDQVDA